MNPIKALARRLAFLALIGASVGLMLIGKLETVLVEEVRAAITDAAAPVLELISQPVAYFTHFARGVQELSELKSENARLRAENERLRRWQLLAHRLDGENEALRRLLRFKPEPASTLVSARVIADTGSAFVKTVLINAGSRDGLAVGQTVMSGEGLIGRIAQVGRRSARVLLITDLKSKLPVIVGEARRRAILAGDNSDFPLLEHVDSEMPVANGDLVLTSGHGGMFPPGVPVGRVMGASGGVVRVRALADWHQLEFVRVVDYRLQTPIETGLLE